MKSHVYVSAYTDPLRPHVRATVNVTVTKTDAMDHDYLATMLHNAADNVVSVLDDPERWA